MKHKKFNEIKPYVYFIKNKITGQKYFGARYKNFTKDKKTPNEDLGKVYFSSQKKLSKLFKKNISDYIFKPIFTFDTVQETLDFELKHNKKIIKQKKWLNLAAFPAIIHTEEMKKEYSKRMKGKGNPNFGKTLSKEYKEKIANSLKGSKSPWYGKKHKQETLEKMRFSQTGKKRSEEHLNKMKIIFGGKNNPMFGKKHAYKSILRMKVSAKLRKKTYGQKFSAETRKKLSKKAKERFSKKEFKEKHRKAILAGFKKGRINPMLGRKHSQETILKMKGRKLSKETKRKISISQKKRYKAKL